MISDALLLRLVDNVNKRPEFWMKSHHVFTKHLSLVAQISIVWPGLSVLSQSVMQRRWFLGKALWFSALLFCFVLLLYHQACRSPAKPAPDVIRRRSIRGYTAAARAGAISAQQEPHQTDLTAESRAAELRRGARSEASPAEAAQTSRGLHRRTAARWVWGACRLRPSPSAGLSSWKEDWQAPRWRVRFVRTAGTS